MRNLITSLVVTALSFAAHAQQPAAPASSEAAARTMVSAAEVTAMIAKAKADPRNYALLEELNTKPRTTYLSKVRNPNPEIEASA